MTASMARRALRSINGNLFGRSLATSRHPAASSIGQTLADAAQEHRSSDGIPPLVG
jgi:hypothetical protein